jgi:hypothetical protein
MLTMHEGLRWFDQRRYGITMYRRLLSSNKFSVTEANTAPKGDPRRTVQLPAAVINAGLPANPR